MIINGRPVRAACSAERGRLSWVGMVFAGPAQRDSTSGCRNLAEDLDDISFELSAYLGGGPEEQSSIVTQIHVGQADSTWPGRSHALLYVAKRTEEGPV